MARRGRVEIPNPDRVLWPAEGLTKADLVGHYARVADRMVPLVRDRPVTMVQHHRGAGQRGVFIKQAPGHAPAWIPRIRMAKKGGHVDHLSIGAAADLRWMAGQSTITIHVGTARGDDLAHPDRLILDLDPPSPEGFERVKEAALVAGELLRGDGLATFAMATGSSGLHVVCPLRRTATYQAVRAYAEDVLDRVAGRLPDTTTRIFRIADRGDRIYLDPARNAHGAHAVAPYSVRALPGAPVAVPLWWEELSDPAWTSARGVGLRDVEARLALGDPWAHIARRARALPG